MSAGWMPPLGAIVVAAYDRNIPVAVDAAQLAPHRPLPAEAARQQPGTALAAIAAPSPAAGRTEG